jgi:hypothetical protein
MKPDMSRQAVTARLKRVAQLRELSFKLGKARIVPRAQAPKNADDQPTVKRRT